MANPNRAPKPVSVALLDLRSRSFGLPDSQFPFMPDNAEEKTFVNQEIDNVLIAIEPMIEMFVGKLYNYTTLSREDVEDVKQDVRLHLAINSLPKYNRSKLNPRNNKSITLCTFVYICIHNYIMTQSRKMTTKNKRRITSGTDPDSVFAFTASNEQWVSDGRIYELAADMIANPDQYLGSHEHIQLFEGIVKSRDQKNHEVGMEVMGYNNMKTRRELKKIQDTLVKFVDDIHECD